MNIFIKDSLRQSVEIASNGHETVLYDDLGLPNVMVIIPQFKINKVEPSRTSIISYDFTSDTASVPYIIVGKEFSDYYKNNNEIIVFITIYNYFKTFSPNYGFVKLKTASNHVINGNTVTKHEIEFDSTIHGAHFEKGTNLNTFNKRIIDSNSNPVGEVSYFARGALEAANELYEAEYDPETQTYSPPTLTYNEEDEESDNSATDEIYPAFKRGELYTDKIFISKYRARQIGEYNFPISYRFSNSSYNHHYTIPSNINYIEQMHDTVNKKGRGWHIMNIWEQTIISYIYNNLNGIHSSEIDFLKGSLERIEDKHIVDEKSTYPRSNYPYSGYIPEIVDGIALNARSEFNVGHGVPRIFEYYQDNDVGYSLNNGSYDFDSEKWVRNCLAGITSQNTGQTITSHSDPNILKLEPSGASNLNFNDIQNITRNSNYIQQISKEHKRDLVLMGIDGELDRISGKNKHRRLGFYENYTSPYEEDYSRTVCYSGINLNKTLNSSEEIDIFDPTKGVYRENSSDLFFGFLTKREFDVHVRYCYI